MKNDPLAEFVAWEGESLGPNEDLTAGWHGQLRAPMTLLHVAGAHVTSTCKRVTSEFVEIPAVYVKLIAGVVGTGPLYHVLEALVDANVARELGTILIEGANRSELDATIGWGN